MKKTLMLCSLIAMSAACVPGDKTAPVKTDVNQAKLPITQIEGNNGNDIISSASTASGPRIEAEDYDQQVGTRLIGSANKVGYIDNGDSLTYSSINFTIDGTRSTESLRIRYAAANSCGRFNIYIDNKLTATFNAEATGGWNNYVEKTVNLNRDVQGIYHMVFRAEGCNGVGNLDYFTLDPNRAVQNNPQQPQQPQQPQSSNGPIVEARNYDQQSGTRLVSNDTIVGYIEEGDSLTYSAINFDLDGGLETNQLRMRYSSPTGCGRIDVYLRGESDNKDYLAGTLNASNTGDWRNYVDRVINLQRPVSGVHRVLLKAQGCNGRSIANLSRFTLLSTNDNTDSRPTERVGTKIEAESFDEQEGIRLVKNDQIVGYIDDGDSLTYENINFEIDGSRSTESLIVRYASPKSCGSFDIYLDDKLAATLPIASTGGWGNYVKRSINLNKKTKETQTMVVRAKGCNSFADLDYFELSPNSLATTQPPTIPTPRPTTGAHELSDRVLIVYNSAHSESLEVANHYRTRRGIPSSNLCEINIDSTKNINQNDQRTAEYSTKVFNPIRDCLNRVGKDKILYIVMSYLTPYRKINTRDYKSSIDSALATIFLGSTARNPYHAKSDTRNGVYKDFESFAEFRQRSNDIVYSVFRLDGPSAAIAKGLVDKAIVAEGQKLTGTGCFDNRPSGVPGSVDAGFGIGDYDIWRSSLIVGEHGYNIIRDTQFALIGDEGAEHDRCENVAFYGGWYSGAYNNSMTFRPGAMAVHIFSFSARNFRQSTNNWSGSLLAAGVTFTYGTIEEPFLANFMSMDGVYHDILNNGASIGDAAFRNTNGVNWHHIYFGDPLYKPRLN